MKINKKMLANLRNEYKGEILYKDTVAGNPLVQFEKWMGDALTAEVKEATACTLATSDSAQPTVRVVLLKGIDDQGFVLFTNYNSRKARNIEKNPNVALNFFWPEISRQVNIEGKAVKISKKESDEYFNSRPKGSQIGSLLSPQSEVIPDRKFLDNRMKKLEKKYENIKVPRPEHWGGYHILPHRIEFWQGHPNRLHDRILYFLSKDKKSWKMERLAP